MTELMFGLVIGVLFLIAWVGGSHTTSRNSGRTVAALKAQLERQNERINRLDEENFALQVKLSEIQLQSQAKIHELETSLRDMAREAARLSADLAAVTKV